MRGPEGFGISQQEAANFRAKKIILPGFKPVKADNDNTVETAGNNVVQLRPGQEKLNNTPGILSARDTATNSGLDNKTKTSEENDTQKPIHKMSFSVNGSYFLDNTRLKIIENSPEPDLPKGNPTSTGGHEMAHGWTMYKLHGPGSVHSMSVVPDYSKGYLGVTHVSHFSAAVAVAADEDGYSGGGSDLDKVRGSGHSVEGARAQARPILDESKVHRRVAALFLDDQKVMSGTQLPEIEIFVDQKIQEAEDRKGKANIQIREADGSEKTVKNVPIFNGTVQVPEAAIYEFKPRSKYPQSGQAFPKAQAA